LPAAPTPSYHDFSYTPSPAMIAMSGIAERMSFQSLPVFWPVIEPM
jgi:hypothetical protein